VALEQTDDPLGFACVIVPGVAGVELTVTLVFCEPPLLQPALLVTVQLKLSVAPVPAVKVTVEPVWPAVIVPPLIVQLYDAAPVGTEAVLPVELAQTDDGALIVELGRALMVTLVFCEPPLLQPVAVTVTVQFKTTLPLVLAVKVI
jgi:hypothetical protein